MYEVKEYRYGKPNPVEVEVLFSLSYHDWLKFSNSDAWKKAESLLEYLQTGQYKEQPQEMQSE